MSDPNDDIEETMTSSLAYAMDARSNFSKALGEIEYLLKDGGVIAALTARGINASLGLVAVHGLRAYLIEGKKAQAAEDFATVSEEIFGRIAASVINSSGEGSS